MPTGNLQSTAETNDIKDTHTLQSHECENMYLSTYMYTYTFENYIFQCINRFTYENTTYPD